MRVLAATLLGYPFSIKRTIALTSIYGATNIFMAGYKIKYGMETELLIAHGNQCREDNKPEQALAYYAQAFAQDRRSASAFNNYGNVLRECGDPEGAIPFLQRAIQLDHSGITAQFNLAVSYLLKGDYANGWPQYESRWQYEHLNGLLPNFPQPRWTGQELKDKTILVIGEQGHGDNIQFIRFIGDLYNQGARVILQVNSSLIPLFQGSPAIAQLLDQTQTPSEFDYWTPIMSIPGIVGCSLENLGHVQYYLTPDPTLVKNWLNILGPKKRLRVGFCWSGRRDTWINRHKGMPFEVMVDLIKRNPDYEWINLQADCTPEEEAALVAIGVKAYPGAIRSFADSAALIHNLDVVLSVDTAVAHLAGALGRPVWVMLNWFGTDWRWLLNRDSSPWYSTARLFRQPSMGDWTSVTDKVHKFLSWFKI